MLWAPCEQSSGSPESAVATLVACQSGDVNSEKQSCPAFTVHRFCHSPLMLISFQRGLDYIPMTDEEMGLRPCSCSSGRA